MRPTEQTAALFPTLVEYAIKCVREKVPEQHQDDLTQDVWVELTDKQLYTRALTETDDLTSFRKFASASIWYAALNAVRTYQQYHQADDRMIDLAEVADQLATPAGIEERIQAREFWRDIEAACPQAITYEKSYQFHDETTQNRRKIAKVFEDHELPVYMLTR